MLNLQALRTDAAQDFAADFDGQGFRRKDSALFAWEKLHKLSGDVRGSKGNGRGKKPASANGVERGKQNVAAHQHVYVFLWPALNAFYHHSGGEARVLQNALPNQTSDGPW